MARNSPRRIWTVGASSRLAIGMQRAWARPGTHFVLAGRDQGKLRRVASDLLCRGASSAVCRDLSPPARESEEMDLLLIALGSLSGQEKWQKDPGYRRGEWKVNTSVVFDWVEWGARNIETYGSGKLAVISSVASDRARRSNYGYGAAKAALEFYMNGVAHRLAPQGGTVVILKPGPTDTPMTLGTAAPFLAHHKTVVSDLVKAVEKGVSVSYSPRHWRLIMQAIKICPRLIWNKLNL